MTTLPPSIRKCLHVLTRRETEVLSLMAHGRTAKEIGETLDMSPRTATIHIQRIIWKLRAEDSNQAVAIAVRDGMLAP